MENRVIRFAERRTAYSFVAELRRLYDLSRWADLWVYQTADGVLVDIPIRDGRTDSLTDLARRFGGWAPLGGDDLELLRAAVKAAEESRRMAHRPGQGELTVGPDEPAEAEPRARQAVGGRPSKPAHQPRPGLLHAHAHQPADLRVAAERVSSRHQAPRAQK